MLWLDSADREAAGQKARMLARARARGLPVPDGVVLTPDEAVDEAALAEAAAQLGGERFAVRSSSALEDRVGGAAAGVFTSLLEIPRADLGAAVATVRAAAGGAAVTSYLAARRLDPEATRLAVLIQPMVRAARYGVAHSRGDHFLIEERGPGEPEWGEVEARRLPRDDTGALAHGLRALEALVGGPVDAELARTGDDVVFLQARPLVPAAATVADAAFAQPGLDGRWRLDAEHNPDPLSPAQAELVAYVDALGFGPRQRVVQGYLYVAPRTTAASRPNEAAPPATSLASNGATPLVAAELPRHFHQVVRPACARLLEDAERDGSLPGALAAYGSVYRRYVDEIGPVLRELRRRLDGWLRATLGEPLARHGALLGGLGGLTLERDQALWEYGRAPEEARLAALLARFGDYAPAWDVAVPVDRERPERVREQARRLAATRAPREQQAEATRAAERHAAAVRARLDAEAAASFDALWAEARAALPIAEDDDWLFFAAQATVRRSLRRRAATLPLATPDDVFYLPFAVVDAASPPAAAELHALVAAARAAQAQAAARLAPALIVDGEPEWPAPPARDVLRGHATAGHARGRAVVVRTLADAPLALPEDAVLVMPALLPSLTPLLPGARALVTDHGGATSHGATLAREYGLPAVLGVGRATALADGCALYVDGENGRVYVLD